MIKLAKFAASIVVLDVAIFFPLLFTCSILSCSRDPVDSILTFLFIGGMIALSVLALIGAAYLVRYIYRIDV